MKNLIQDTIERIERQHISPEPRWKYLVKKYGLWIFFAMILISVAVSFSVALDNVRSLDWDLYNFTHQSRVIYLLSILPYFWIILVAIFLVSAFFEIRKTETGYRYSLPKMGLIIFGGIFFLGLFMVLFGFGGRLNSKLAKEIPFYGRHMMVTKETQWMQPSKGFLAGTIISVSENNLGIEDLNGDDWSVSMDEKTSIKPAADISQDEMVKIIGTKAEGNNFKAKEIRPWVGRGMNNNQNAKGFNGEGYHSGERKRGR